MVSRDAGHCPTVFCRCPTAVSQGAGRCPAPCAGCSGRCAASSTASSTAARHGESPMAGWVIRTGRHRTACLVSFRGAGFCDEESLPRSGPIGPDRNVGLPRERFLTAFGMTPRGKLLSSEAKHSHRRQPSLRAKRRRSRLRRGALARRDRPASVARRSIRPRADCGGGGKSRIKKCD